jgi:two-component system, LytTR family, sensor kinase
MAWLVSFAVWTVVGVFNIAPTVIGNLSSDKPFPRLFVELITESVWVWSLYTPLILWLCLWQPLRGRAIAIHAVCALALAVVDPIIDTPFVQLVEPKPEPYKQRLLEDLFINVFSYVAVAGIGHALAYRRRLAEQRTRDAELETQLMRARLDALTARLHPHFLFNALHSVSALIRTGERTEAIHAVAVLGDLLRDVLHANDQVVPLAREVAWIRRYLEIEQMRFQDRLTTEVRIDDDLEQALVPPLILNVLVENAIRHGVEARVGASRVEVIARRDDDALCLEVSDEGDAAAASTEAAREGNGLGLRVTRERLAHMYGDTSRVDLDIRAGGSRATIRVPYRTETA